jgi:membrane protein involved in colicin uptake
MQLPPGTLAEVYFQIKEKEAELERYRKELKEVEIEEAKQRAAEEERVRLEKQEAQRKAKEEEDKRRELLRRQAEQIKTEESTAAQIRQASVYEKPAEKVLGFVPTPAEHDPLSSIKVILDALNDAGCSACAARLVAIREMKKYARKEAA